MLNTFTADLPLTLTSFIGREKELAEIKRLLTTTRLLTLTGAGGCGKTRLALEIAHTSAPEFQDGITWVDLAPLSDPERVVPAVAAALQVREQVDQPLIETLTSVLATRQLLLVLDNCEHLLGACGPLTNALLRVCAEVQVLATSREPLNTNRETIFLVPPLALPQAPSEQAALDSEAVRLFTLRAAETLPSFVLTPENLAPVVKVCERLDGLPLAIELAAARVKMLTVSEIAERLDDRFRLLTRSPAATLARHQTLRAAMDWSYHLLSASEQTLLRRLSIFAGGFTLEAAELICADEQPNAELPQVDILDLLSNLVEKSLVVVAERVEGMPARYRLLETVREYAQEKLGEAGEWDALHVRQLDWCLALAERAEPELFESDRVKWLRQLTPEHDNIRLALQTAEHLQAADALLRLASALQQFWNTGALSEGRSWLQRALRLAADRVSPPAVKAWNTESFLAYRQGDYTAMQSAANEALRQALQLEDTRGTADAHYNLGIYGEMKGYLLESREHYLQSMALYRELNQRRGIMNTLNGLAHVARLEDKEAEARRYYEQGLALARTTNDRRTTMLLLISLGNLLLESEPNSAEPLFAESLAHLHALDELSYLPYVFNGLGEVARYRGDTATASRHYEDGLHHARALTLEDMTGQLLLKLGDVAAGMGDLPRAADYFSEGTQTYARLGRMRRIVIAVHLSAKFIHQLGYPAQAVTLFVAGLHCLKAKDFGYLGDFDGEACTAADAAARAALSQAELDAAIVAGRALTLEQAVELALSGVHLPPRQPSTQAQSEMPSSTVGARQIHVEAKARLELEIFGLGQSVVARHGKPLGTSDWKYTKSKELFFYLLAHPQSTKAQIGLDLWADESPTQLRRAFHRTIHFARKALGRPEWITFEDDVYAVNGELKYFYDVELFEKHLAHARGWQSRDDQARRKALEELEAAAELYRGDFLPDVEGGDWILFRREALRKQFLDALLTLGQHYFDQQQYQQAAAFYQRVLTHDNYLELAHRELMRCLARQGEVSQALRHYQTLAELLQREVGAPPSPQTNAIYERLRRGESV